MNKEQQMFEEKYEKMNLDEGVFNNSKSLGEQIVAILYGDKGSFKYLNSIGAKIMGTMTTLIPGGRDSMKEGREGLMWNKRAGDRYVMSVLKANGYDESLFQNVRAIVKKHILSALSKAKIETQPNTGNYADIMAGLSTGAAGDDMNHAMEKARRFIISEIDASIKK